MPSISSEVWEEKQICAATVPGNRASLATWASWKKTKYIEIKLELASPFFILGLGQKRKEHVSQYLKLTRRGSQENLCCCQHPRLRVQQFRMTPAWDRSLLRHWPCPQATVPRKCAILSLGHQVQRFSGGQGVMPLPGTKKQRRKHPPFPGCGELRGRRSLRAGGRLNRASWGCWAFNELPQVKAIGICCYWN